MVLVFVEYLFHLSTWTRVIKYMKAHFRKPQIMNLFKEIDEKDVLQKLYILEAIFWISKAWDRIYQRLNTRKCF